MKNIYILPTNRLNKVTILKNIYITSDEDIKEGDNVILSSGRLAKAKLKYGVLGFDAISGIGLLSFEEDDKAVILTTDPDLIKDGVQKFDDEFLEWFVKNPSCEYVEIEKAPYDGTKSIDKYWGGEYKIIIPKEEMKLDLEKEMFELEQELDIPSHLRWYNSKPKQKTTFEEAKLRQLFKNRSNCYADADDVVQAMDENCFIETIKELQFERMYSKEAYYESKIKELQEQLEIIWQRNR